MTVLAYLGLERCWSEVNNKADRFFISMNDGYGFSRHLMSYNRASGRDWYIVGFSPEGMVRHNGIFHGVRLVLDNTGKIMEREF